MGRFAKICRITLKDITCTSIGEEGGNNLQVYGHLRARGVFRDVHGNEQLGAEVTLWATGEDDAIVLNRGAILPINAVDHLTIFLGGHDQLWLGGTMIERDDFADDVLGRDGFRKIEAANIVTEHVGVGFHEAGQEVVASFQVEVLETKFFPNA